MISQDIISDEHFNALSLEAQNIFIRMLTVSDDCGVVPANTYRLNVLINTPKKIIPKLDSILIELSASGLGYIFDYREERFFAFKPSSFQDYQSYILKKATKSEYLRIPKEEYENLSKNFQELPRVSIHKDESAVSTVQVESTGREQIVESKKKHGDDVLLSDEEYDKLVVRLGSRERTDKCIEILDNAKGSKGYTYKSDYKAILSWVVKELEEREKNGTHNGTRNANTGVRPTAEAGKYDSVVKRSQN